jgi:hypothetical protein
MDKLERLKRIIERKLAESQKEKRKIISPSHDDLYDLGYEQGRINLCQYFLEEIKEINKREI